MNSDRTLPAFPIRDDVDVAYQDYGMTLRDYFATRAMQAIYNLDQDDILSFDRIAIRAYQMADAMLRVRIEPELQRPLMGHGHQCQNRCPGIEW